MIIYHSHPEDLWDIIADLGRVYADAIARSSLLLEAAQKIYATLLQEHDRKIDDLTRLNRLIITAHDNGFGLSHAELFCAAGEGNLEAVKALRDGSLGSVCPWNVWTTEYAAKEGRLEVLRALRDGSLGGVCQFDSRVLALAARGGHLDVLRALRDGSLGEVCPWNEMTTGYAAEEGRLKVLRALRNGSLGAVCPWNKPHCRFKAALFEQAEMVELIDSGELD